MTTFSRWPVPDAVARQQRSTVAERFQREAGDYIASDPEFANTLNPIVAAVAEAEETIVSLFESHRDSPAGVKLRQEYVDRALQTIDRYAPADEDAEIARLEEHCLRLKPTDDGKANSYVLREPKADPDLVKNGTPRQAGIWSWFLQLPSDAARATAYYAAIDNGDVEVVQAIELLPSAMSILTGPAATEVKRLARGKKIGKLPPEHRATLERDKQRVARLKRLADNARDELTKLLKV